MILFSRFSLIPSLPFATFAPFLSPLDWLSNPLFFLFSIFCFSSFFYWPTPANFVSFSSFSKKRPAPLTSCSSPFIAMVLAYKFGHAWARIGAIWVSSMGVMWSFGEVVAWGKEERQVVHACWRVCFHMKGGSRAWSW